MREIESLNTDSETELSGLEQIYYMFDASTPTHVCLAIEVEGATSIEQWRTAVSKVADRTPLLSSRIVRNTAGQLVFQGPSDIALPFHVSPEDPRNWIRAMASEVFARIPMESGPLFRATLLCDSTRATLLLSLSHCIVDGRSAPALIRDILLSLAGEHLGSPSPECSLYSLLENATSGNWYPKSPRVSSAWPVLAPPPPQAVLHMEADTFDVELTTKLRTRARNESSTVHGALQAALLRLFGMDAVVTSGIDVRSILGASQEGLRPIISSFAIRAGQTISSFWDCARNTSQALHETIRLEAIADVYTKLEEFRGIGLTPGYIRDFKLRLGPAPEILLSNLGLLPIPLSYGDGSIRLKGFWGSTYPSTRNTHFLCCSTVDGSLQLFYTAQKQLPELFERLRMELTAAIN